MHCLDSVCSQILGRRACWLQSRRVAVGILHACTAKLCALFAWLCTHAPMSIPRLYRGLTEGKLAAAVRVGPNLHQANRRGGLWRHHCTPSMSKPGPTEFRPAGNLGGSCMLWKSLHEMIGRYHSATPLCRPLRWLALPGPLRMPPPSCWRAAGSARRPTSTVWAS